MFSSSSYPLLSFQYFFSIPSSPIFQIFSSLLFFISPSHLLLSLKSSSFRPLLLFSLLFFFFQSSFLRPIFSSIYYLLFSILPLLFPVFSSFSYSLFSILSSLIFLSPYYPFFSSPYYPFLTFQSSILRTILSSLLRTILSSLFNLLFSVLSFLLFSVPFYFFSFILPCSSYAKKSRFKLKTTICKHSKNLVLFFLLNYFCFNKYSIILIFLNPIKAGGGAFGAPL